MAFNFKTWYLISKDLADLWGNLEEDINKIQTEQLTKYYTKGDEEWYRLQMQEIQQFKDKVEIVANRYISKINEESRIALEKAISLADIEINKSIKEIISSSMSVEKSRFDFLATAIQRLIDFNNGEIKALISSSVIRNNQFVNNVRLLAQNIENMNIRVKSGMWNHTQGLYDLIKKQTEEGIKYGVPVTYADGRKVSFKSHMEMSVRTKIQSETSNRMEHATRDLGIIFFLASEHADCADDHAPYQGKIYVNDNWDSVIVDDELKNKIREYIRRKNIKTLQWVKGPPAYLTTRPNCRHFFVPITIEQALGNINELKSILKTKKGDYLKKNYDDLKQQRYNERAIRFYKERLNNNLILFNNTNDPVLRREILRDIQKDKALVKEWQARQRELILSNKNLMREYKREDVNKLAYDFGVSLHLKKDSKNYAIPPTIINNEIYRSVFEDGFIPVDKIVLTKERLNHIITRHPELTGKEKDLISYINDPDYVINAAGRNLGNNDKAKNSADIIKLVDGGGYYISIAFSDGKNFDRAYTSIITAIYMSDKNIKKMINKKSNKIVYKKSNK